MILSFAEVLDILIMSAAVGYIFMDFLVRRPVHVTQDYFSSFQKRFNWGNLWFALCVVAPSVILHEAGHKFVAMAYGLQAVFHAAYTWLMIGVLLKLLNTGLIFFVPAYVSIYGSALPSQLALVSFAGPGVNLILWLVPKALLRSNIRLKHNTKFFLIILSKINMFLFIFNMLPIPGFDGFSVYSNLFRAFA